MLRIRRVYDDLLPIDRRAIAQVQQMLREQFPAVSKAEVADLPDRLRDPLKHHFRSFLYVADDLQGNVRGFALVSHDPALRFWYLDYIAANLKGTGSGVGGALYTRIREEAAATDPIGLFFECPPDDPQDMSAPALLRQNIARMRFYERFGVRPTVGNDYRAPIRPGQKDMPYLMFDSLDRDVPLRRQAARSIVRAVLERKYRHVCSPEYIAKVAASFQDDPVRLREFRYVVEGLVRAAARPAQAWTASVALVVNDKHDIHHVRDRGYVEAPARIPAILRELERMGAFRRIRPRDFGEKPIRAVHDGAFVDYLKRACRSLPPGKSVYPYVFPIRNQARPPKELSIRAGYYCIDTFTPLNQNVFPAAKRAVHCSLTAAEELLRGTRLAYALVRPPGHHAEHRSFGGFCYFNNAAIAAQFLCSTGPVAILDVDYHHGNGQEEIFYERRDVLTVSIHGHPRFAYPYFSGFEEDAGRGEGEGFNVNYALPEKVDGERYRQTLTRALARIRAFAPRFLVVALGLDPAKGDPTGTWSLTGKDFEENGRMIGRLHLPTLVVQEGGYRTRTLGSNASYFFSGLIEGQATPTDRISRKIKPR